MYRTLAPSVLKEMEECGNVVLTVKPGWEQVNQWSSKPSYISYCIGTRREHIFTCYMSQENTTIQITNMEATKLIANNKALIDAYMYVTLKELIDFAETQQVKRLIVDSFISSAADHMLDLGFYVTPKGTFSANGSRGCKTIKE